MSLIKSSFRKYSSKSRFHRAKIFLGNFEITKHTKILDLGSESGENINQVLSNQSIDPANIYIADICEESIRLGSMKFGFTPILIDETGRLPFPDKFFDIVYCSSVIEHVTVDKGDVWKIGSGKTFKAKARIKQQQFANEIKRLGKGYFVQTPYKYFPIESHSWLPFVSFLPRHLLLPLLKITNRFWVKKTQPDWNLLTSSDFSSIFSEAKIVNEKSFGITKSMMAIHGTRQTAERRLESKC
jgi:SAM-dependent methyltransferase